MTLDPADEQHLQPTHLFSCHSEIDRSRSPPPAIVAPASAVRPITIASIRRPQQACKHPPPPPITTPMQIRDPISSASPALTISSPHAPHLSQRPSTHDPTAKLHRPWP
ncbi:hypothetical protein ACLOJK_024226 [Asimina triloba]